MNIIRYHIYMSLRILETSVGVTLRLLPLYSYNQYIYIRVTPYTEWFSYLKG